MVARFDRNRLRRLLVKNCLSSVVVYDFLVFGVIRAEYNQQMEGKVPICPSSIFLPDLSVMFVIKLNRNGFL